MVALACLFRSDEVWFSEPCPVTLRASKHRHSAEVGEEAQQRACKLQEATRRAMFAPPLCSLQQNVC